ncbi:MAG: NADH-quinone oxidoreductase subunit NuoH [Gemmataceae bacterium]|nr:NADH-quinone oxidoreductase subunit NuoH [Gemmataceae bacterium]
MDRSLLITILTIVGFMAVSQGIIAYLILLERKIAAWVQDRIGPNRVGPLGLLQPIADGLKFLFKEEVFPTNVDRLLFVLAPSIAMITALLAAAVVPFGPTSVPPSTEYQFVIAPGTDIGILFTFAVGSLAVYGIILGGWASNNKYSFLGALRSSAQLISYEIPMGLSVVGVVLYAGSLNLERIVQQQVEGGWNVVFQPLAFLLFLTAVFAECNRLPFDLPEAEQELVGGYHTEYSAMKFALFFLGEYMHMITTSLMLTVVFWGGWYFPGISTPTSHVAVKFIVFIAKVVAFIVFYMLIRWTIPRFRFDQLMSMAWKVLIPLAIANLVCVMVVREFELSHWLLPPLSIALIVGAGVVSFRWPAAPQRRMPASLEPVAR